MLGDELVAALRDPGGAEIAAAGMHGDRHVGGLAFERRVGHARVDRRQAVGIVAARLRLLALLRIADHRPGGVVELQVTAAGVVEGADRLATGGGDIVEEFVEVGIDLLADHRAALPEMERRWAPGCHLRRDVAVRLQELEMLDHADGRRSRPCRRSGSLSVLGLDAVELDAGRCDNRRTPLRPRKKSKCHQERRNSPSVASLKPTSACFLMIFSISRSSTVLQRGGVDFAFGEFGARLLQRRGSQQAADMSARKGGVVRWVIVVHSLLQPVMPAKAGIQ